MEAIQELIANLGFPVFVAIVLLLQYKKSIDRLTDVLLRIDKKMETLTQEIRVVIEKEVDQVIEKKVESYLLKKDGYVDKNKRGLHENS